MLKIIGYPNVVGGWVGGWVEVRVVLIIAYSNQQIKLFLTLVRLTCREKYISKLKRIFQIFGSFSLFKLLKFGNSIILGFQVTI
jgi:hypothetical protein